LFNRLTNRRHGKTGPFEQGRGRSAFLIEQGQQHVFHVDALMASTLRRIAQHPKLELQVAVVGMHLSPAYGLTVREIEAALATLRAE